jgi:hypothetical protein
MQREQSSGGSQHDLRHTSRVRPLDVWIENRLRGVVVLGSLACLLIVPACSLVGAKQTTSPGTRASGTRAYEPTISAPTLNVGVCIDPTLSTATPFSQAIESLVAHVVASWAVSPPAPTATMAVSPHAGLNLWLRQVETNSFDSSNSFLHFVIPSVPGLQGRLDATNPNFIDDDPLWVKARSSVIGKATAALQASSTAAKAIQSWSLETWQDSEIAGCVSGLSDTVPSPSRFVLASDLEQNEPPQVTGNLSHTTILVVQPCDDTAAKCLNLQASFRNLLSSEGASSIQFIRPEDASTVLPTFLDAAP